MDQAIGRAVRIGQEETVEVTLLLLKEEASMNIDQMMMKKADTKRNILSELFTYSSKGIEPEEAEEAEETEDPK
jgi:SNF2 family DNA or RNA helicase